jgi:hypothetical protein
MVARAMGIFEEMYERRAIESAWEYKQLRRKLSEAISRGYIEQIPAIKRNRYSLPQEWFRDKETGDIYSLTEPVDNRGFGSWVRVDPQDFVEPRARACSDSWRI